MWLEKPEGYSFKPGQYCTIGSQGIERAYSIVSAPHEETLELFVEVVPPPDGALTPLLDKLDSGKTVTIRPRAKGIFVFKPKVVNHLLVATVTGVVPYVSFLRDYLHRDVSGHRFYVLQGASYQDEFTYDGELDGLAKQHPDLVTFVPTVSRPDEERNASWEGERPSQHHRRALRREVAPDAGRHPRLRLRPSRDDRGRQRAYGRASEVAPDAGRHPRLRLRPSRDDRGRQRAYGRAAAVCVLRRHTKALHGSEALTP